MLLAPSAYPSVQPKYQINCFLLIIYHPILPYLTHSLFIIQIPIVPQYQIIATIEIQGLSRVMQSCQTVSGSEVFPRTLTSVTSD